MTITVPGMRSNKPVSMDIDQLRGWASLMDRAMIASLIVTILAVAVLGITTFLSFRYSGAVRAHEQATLDAYKGMESQAAQFERNATAQRERAASLELELSTERGRAAVLERDVSQARERAVVLEQVVREANERAAQAARESAAAAEKARPPAFDAAAIRQRLADVGKLVRDAATRAPEPNQEPAPKEAAEAVPTVPRGASESTTDSRSTPPSPIVVSLRRFAGTKAALFLLGQVSDAAAVGAALSTELSEAGWAPQTWTWGGVAGIFGVVVLVKDGSDQLTQEAASALVESLLSAGYNATKGDWPANWGRFRGTLNGPQTPSPIDAAIRIVVGSKARGAI